MLPSSVASSGRPSELLFQNLGLPRRHFRLPLGSLNSHALLDRLDRMLDVQDLLPLFGGVDPRLGLIRRY